MAYGVSGVRRSQASLGQVCDKCGRDVSALLLYRLSVAM